MSTIDRDAFASYFDPASAHALNARNAAVRDAPDDKGRGVFALRDFLPGEVVITGQILREEAERNIYTIQMGPDRHTIFDEPAVLLNHSCMPNVVVSPNRFGAFDFVAARPIPAQTEICFDYASTEMTMIAPQVCLCGAAECRGKPGGYTTLPSDHPIVVHQLVAPYIKDAAHNA